MSAIRHDSKLDFFAGGFGRLHFSHTTYFEQFWERLIFIINQNTANSRFDCDDWNIAETNELSIERKSRSWIKIHLHMHQLKAIILVNQNCGHVIVANWFSPASCVCPRKTKLWLWWLGIASWIWILFYCSFTHTGSWSVHTRNSNSWIALFMTSSATILLISFPDEVFANWIKPDKKDFILGSWVKVVYWIAKIIQIVIVRGLTFIIYSIQKV